MPAMLSLSSNAITDEKQLSQLFFMCLIQSPWGSDFVSSEQMVAHNNFPGQQTSQPCPTQGRYTVQE